METPKPTKVIPTMLKCAGRFFILLASHKDNRKNHCDRNTTPSMIRSIVVQATQLKGNNVFSFPK